MDGTFMSFGSRASSGRWKAVRMATRGRILPWRASTSSPRVLAMSPVMLLPDPSPNRILHTLSFPGTGRRKGKIDVVGLRSLGLLLFHC